MKKIADTIGFLSAWSLSKFEVLHHRLQEMLSKTRRFLGDHQCNLDTHYFERIGRGIHKLIKNTSSFYHSKQFSKKPEGY